MENASEALLMAFAVLIFVVALSLGISSFSLARQTTQSIVEMTDREFDYTYVDFNSTDTSRIVGIETVIPSLYRAYRENFIVRFYKANGEELPVYRKKVRNVLTKTNEINLEKEAVANQEKATLFVDCLLYGNLKDNFNTCENLSITNFYDTIKEMKFKEELGIYYIEDLEDEKQDNSSNGEEISDSDITDAEVSDVNKTEKRVITYTVIN